MYFILSPCGTSLLTNQSKQEERQLIFRYANVKDPGEIPDSDRQKLDQIIKRVQEKLLAAGSDYDRVAKLSAELNGIIKFYGHRLPARSDVHFLLSTDTYLGNETAQLVKEWLEIQSGKFVVQVYRQTDLRTVDIDSFQLALSDLVQKLSEEIPEYSRRKYRIVFNLTGGFKSIQGFLQSIANFYADETIYIFETSDDLLRIPKLPIRLDALPIISENLLTFRRLALELPVSLEDVQTIPETLLLIYDGQITLSPWGAIIWEEAREKLYGEQILPSPDEEKVRLSKKFMKQCKELPPERKIMINKRIDQLIKHLIKEDYNPSSLDFKELKGRPKADSTHEMDAWADGDARRMFGHFEGKTFILDSLDKGLH